MAANVQKLVMMANQIAAFFNTQPGNTQAAEIAGHLKAFWEPRMLQALYAHVDAGGAVLFTTHQPLGSARPLLRVALQSPAMERGDD